MRALAIGLVMSVGTATAAPSPYIYVNRCSGGCVVAGGADDARMQTSSVVGPGMYLVGEFENAAGETGASADAEWAQVLGCLRDVYSPYAVTVTDQIEDVPAGGSYTEAIVAGAPSDLGLSPVLAVAPNTTACSATDDTIVFAFPGSEQGSNRVTNICGAAAQQLGRVFGLEPIDAVDAPVCEVMDGLDCGGERFYRNAAATCVSCSCGPTQNSHERLLSVFGAGVSTVPISAEIIFPTADSTIGDGAAVQIEAGSKRGVSTLELWLNGYKWASGPGAAFGPDGQPDPATSSLTFPDGVPDSIIDIVVKAYDDIGVEADSATVTVTKGAAGGCVSDATCLNGQACADGRCFWAPPIGALGDACTYDQFCTSNQCTSTSSGEVCTQSCITGATDACPSGFDCTEGACVPAGHGGGCNVGGDATPFVLFAFVGLFRRRRA